MADVPPCDGAAPIADQRYAPGSPPSGATEGGSSGPQYLGPSCSSLHVAGRTLTSYAEVEWLRHREFWLSRSGGVLRVSEGRRRVGFRHGVDSRPCRAKPSRSGQIASPAIPGSSRAISKHPPGADNKARCDCDREASPSVRQPDGIRTSHRVPVHGSRRRGSRPICSDERWLQRCRPRQASPMAGASVVFVHP